MAPMLGKRKCRDEVLNLDHDPQTVAQNETNDKLQALFRQHFETDFEPLVDLSPRVGSEQNIEEATAESEAHSDWDGCSEGEEVPVEIIHRSVVPSLKAEITREELTAFMTTKPPSANKTRKSPAKDFGSSNEEASTDAANLKKDLALQRLLKESHLLDSDSSLSHIGRNRHKAVDLRLQDMGSRSSIFKQEKMPLAQRRGISAKLAERDEARRQQAQENGIILEKASKGKTKANVNRQRGIGAPSVGKFQGGMLKLSKKDVAHIEGFKTNRRGRR